MRSTLLRGTASAVALLCACILVDGCSSTVNNITVVSDASPDAPAPTDGPSDATSPVEAASDSGASDASDASDAPFCGDDAAPPGEQCDDGNSAKCDGCEACGRRSWLDVPANAFVQVPSVAAALPAGNATYEAWVKTDGSLGDALYMSSYAAPNNGAFLLRCQNNTRLQFAVQAPGSVLITEPLTTCGDGLWHHVAGTQTVVGNAVTIALYWDGVAVGNATGTTASLGARTTVILGGVTYQQEGLRGSIDEVRISRTVRYNATFVPARRLAADADTVLLLHLDEANGTSIGDASGNGYAGTATGTAWSVDTGYKAAMCL